MWVRRRSRISATSFFERGGLGAAVRYRRRIDETTQARFATVFRRMTLPAQQLQIVRVVRDVPILPIALGQRLDVVDFCAGLNAAMSQAFFAKSLRSLDHELPHSPPFSGAVHLGKTCHRITKITRIKNT